MEVETTQASVGPLHFIAQAWLVILLGLGFGAALAGVELGLRERIAANRLAEIESQAAILLPGTQRIDLLDLEGHTVYRALGEDGLSLGWLIIAHGQGFADRIEVVVGLNQKAAEITGIAILEQKETPALGDRIRDPTWRAQFAGSLSAEALRLSDGSDAPNQIDALSGATISSRAVTNIVNRAVRELLPQLAGNQE